MKLLSICIPTYNRCDVLKENISHLISSENMNFEIVVSDDASTDNTFDVVNQFSDTRIKYYRNKINYGAAYNIHLSFMRASSKYMLLMSDEDLIDTDSIDYLIELLKQEKPIAYIGSGDRIVDKKIFDDDKFENNGYGILKKYGFNIRYMSGILMDTNKYKEVVGNVEFTEAGRLFNSYSFLYGLTKLFFKGKVLFDSRIIYKQIRTFPTRKNNNSPNTPSVYYFEPAGRMDQMKCYIRQISKLNMTLDEKIDIAIKVAYDQTLLCFRVFDTTYLKKLNNFINQEDYYNMSKHIMGVKLDEIIDNMYNEAIASILENFDLNLDYKKTLENDRRIIQQKSTLYKKAKKLNYEGKICTKK